MRSVQSDNMNYLLEISDKSLLVIEERETSEIVVGVPHHAPLGIGVLPCPEHPNADENTGVLGYYTAQLLDCHFIAACNYFIDSNKSRGSDYYRKLADWSPLILVELHGHGQGNARYDIEISCGSHKRTDWSSRLAGMIREKIAAVQSLQNYSVNGDYQQIYFKASQSVSITSERWLAFHIELPYAIRAQKSRYIPFCEILAGSLQDILRLLKIGERT